MYSLRTSRILIGARGWMLAIGLYYLCLYNIFEWLDTNI